MTAPRHQRRPGFFWQGALIMLPVVVLAVVGLVSLRQDERAAETEARKRAAENVQSLARTLGSSTGARLLRFIHLQSDWKAMAHATGQPGNAGHFDDAQLAANIANWERDYPGLRFDDLVFPPAEISVDGRQLDPPDFPVAPVPPQWFLELSPAQKILWENLRAARTPAEIERRQKAFHDSQPSHPAEVAAINLFAPPDQKMRDIALTTEAGIYFADIACYQSLSATNALWTPELWQLVWERTIDHPSFMSSKLAAMAMGLPAPAGVELRQSVHGMEQWWAGETKVRAWLPLLRQLPGLANQAGNLQSTIAWAHWTGASDDEALVIFEPMNFTNLEVAFSGPGYRVWFVPRPVVEIIFRQAQSENKFLIPGYVHAVVAIEGKPLRSTDEMNPVAEPLLLGAAAQTVDLFNDTGAKLEVKFYLVSREQMLAGEHRRESLFGALILGAVLAALVGCLAAWRSFRRQWQVNEMKSNFVSSVSHELRAPIASVRLMAENLECGKIPETSRQNEYFHFIVQECRRLSSLIENVLDFSRIEQHRKQYDLEPTDVLALIRTTVKLMEPYATEKGMRLNLEIPDGEMIARLELNVDGRAIQQALVNLIDNALKHSPKGEVVTVGLKIPDTSNHQPATLHLFVTDHGPGIPAGEHRKIFDRFYRLGSELQRETEGVGIGLSIVKHIIDAHGGKILVESAPGQGSRFIIELPLAVPKTSNETRNLT